MNSNREQTNSDILFFQAFSNAYGAREKHDGLKLRAGPLPNIFDGAKWTTSLAALATRHMGASSYYGWIAGVTSFVVCAALVPAIERLAKKYGLNRNPGTLPIHNAPISRLGGIALFAGFLIGILTLGTGWSSAEMYFCASASLIWAVGLVDDVRSLSALSRLFAQGLAAILLSIGTFGTGPWQSRLLPTLGQCLWVAVFVNAFNFLDGADGIAAGVAGLIAVGYIVEYEWPIVTFGGIVACSLLGSCLGFLLFNFPPASIFMGDAGSTTSGLAIGFMGIDFYEAHPEKRLPLLVPLMFAALPLIDFAFALFRRMRRRSLFMPDRQHFYDLLRQRGWTDRNVAIVTYAVTAVLIALGHFCNQNDWVLALFVVLVIAALAVVTGLRLGSFRAESGESLGQGTGTSHSS